MSEKINLFGLDMADMEKFFSEMGEKPFRARQVMKRIYKKGTLNFDEMTELSGDLRAKLKERASLELPVIVDRQKSRDGTVKLLLELADGERVETVLIPDKGRLTQCISTQVGCAMGCRFCRTASAGLTRNLSAAEIVSQVVAADLSGEFEKRITNIVYMGMGEPLHNFEGTVKSFAIFSAEYGLDLSKRRLTVSTCGLVERIKELPPEIVASLAISLNATTDELRDEVMPVNRAHPIRELIKTLREIELPHRSRYTMEYVLLGGVNDTLKDAARLSKLLAGLKCSVNLIAYNPHGESPYKAPAYEDVKAFQRFLLDKGFTAVMRTSRGEDILAACGQLKAENESAGREGAAGE